MARRRWFAWRPSSRTRSLWKSCTSHVFRVEISLLILSLTIVFINADYWAFDSPKEMATSLATLAITFFDLVLYFYQHDPSTPEQNLGIPVLTLHPVYNISVSCIQISAWVIQLFFWGPFGEGWYYYTWVGKEVSKVPNAAYIARWVIGLGICIAYAILMALSAYTIHKRKTRTKRLRLQYRDEIKAAGEFEDYVGSEIELTVLRNDAMQKETGELERSNLPQQEDSSTTGKTAPNHRRGYERSESFDNADLSANFAPPFVQQPS